MSVKGEKYASKAAMKKHEKVEGAKERMMEYGPKKKAVKKKAAKKKAAKKPAKKKKAAKKAARKPAKKKKANEDVDGVSCFKIRLTRKSGRESVYIIDPKSFYIIRTISKMTANGQEIESTVNLSNYQKLPAGIFIPFTMENSALPAPITMTKVEVNIKIEDTVFKVQQ